MYVWGEGKIYIPCMYWLSPPNPLLAVTFLVFSLIHFRPSSFILPIYMWLLLYSKLPGFGGWGKQVPPCHHAAQPLSLRGCEPCGLWEDTCPPAEPWGGTLLHRALCATRRQGRLPPGVVILFLIFLILISTLVSVFLIWFFFLFYLLFVFAYICSDLVPYFAFPFSLSH